MIFRLLNAALLGAIVIELQRVLGSLIMYVFDCLFVLQGDQKKCGAEPIMHTIETCKTNITQSSNTDTSNV